MNKQYSSSDLLCLTKQPRLACLLQPNEKILASCEVDKFNHANKSQLRILMVTNQAIYNIRRNANIIKSMISKLVNFQNKFTVRRRIPVQNLQAITLSTQEKNTEFVLHVANQHDYHIRTHQYKNKISFIKCICASYEKLTQNKLAFYFTDQITLQKNCTHKSDMKGKNKNMSKFKTSPTYLNLQNLIDYELPGVKFELKYSHDHQQISIHQFKSMPFLQLAKKQRYFSIATKNIGYESIQTKLSNNHSFILLPHYVYQTQSSLYLLRPLQIGGRMDKLIQAKGSLYKQAFVFYLANLLISLQYLHSKGWLYRNLNLSNIYIKENGYLALEGLERHMLRSKGGLCYEICGKWINVSPEMVLCDGYDQGVDVWQLGICAYIMVTGKHPFFSLNKQQTIKNITNGHIIQKGHSIPNIVFKMLQKDPFKRITLPSLMKHTIFDDVNWSKMQNEEILAPYTPSLSSIKQWEGKVPSIAYIDSES